MFSLFRLAALFSAILLMTTAFSAVQAKTLIETTTSFYDVNGTSAKALFNDIERKKPTATATNTRMQAITKWRVTWTYTMTSDGSQCSITSADVIVKSNIKIPRFTGYTSAPPLLKRKWNKYFTSLYAHEKNHAKNGADAGRAIDKKLKNMRSYSCDALDVRARNDGQAIVDSYFAKDLAYDRRTHNGRSEVKSLSDGASIGTDLNNYKRLFNEDPFDMHRRYERGEGVYASSKYSALWLLNAYAKGSRNAANALSGKASGLRQATRVAIQQHLKSTGYYSSGIDGSFGSGTKSALSKWKKSGNAKSLQKSLLTNKI